MEEQDEKLLVWHHSICLLQFHPSLIQNTEQCRVFSVKYGNSLCFFGKSRVFFQYCKRNQKYKKEKKKLPYNYSILYQFLYIYKIIVICNVSVFLYSSFLSTLTNKIMSPSNSHTHSHTHIISHDFGVKFYLHMYELSRYRS